MKRRRTASLIWSVAFTAVVAVLVSCTGTTGQQVRTASPKTTTTTSTTTPVPDCSESLPPSAKAGQLLMVMVTSSDLAQPLLTEGLVGGFGLKGSQTKDVGKQVEKAVADSPIPPFVASDEEGGTAQRLAKAIRTLPSAAKMAEDPPEAAADLMGKYATDMKALGFNMMFGPVADVGSGSGLGTRSFGKDPAAVATYVGAIVKAVQEAGVIAVVKHWPGIGAGKSDPHNKLSELAPIDELRSHDLLPFQAAFQAGAKGVMVSHSSIPGLTAEGEPATVSQAAITDELRRAEGFKGLVITDSLGMGAILSTTSQDEAAEKAIAAGADIALLSGVDAGPEAHQRLTEAISTGRLAMPRVNESVRRILSAKGMSGPCPDLVGTMTRLANDAAPGNTDSAAGAEDGATTDSKATDPKATEGRDTGINDQATVNDQATD